jgi:hypothetical protein
MDDSDELWERREAKRVAGLALIKGGIARVLCGMNNKQLLEFKEYWELKSDVHEPDPHDMYISKRTWERNCMQYRHAVLNFWSADTFAYMNSRTIPFDPFSKHVPLKKKKPIMCLGDFHANREVMP